MNVDVRFNDMNIALNVEWDVSSSFIRDHSFMITVLNQFWIQKCWDRWDINQKD